MQKNSPERDLPSQIRKIPKPRKSVAVIHSVSARELSIALRGISFNLVPFITILAVNFCHLFAIPDRVPVRLSVGFCPGFSLLPIKPVHSFGIFAIELTGPFLIPVPVSVISALIIVVWGGAIGTPRGPITPTATKSIPIVVGRIPVRTISRVPVRAVSGVPVRVIGGSSIRAIGKVTGRAIRGAQDHAIKHIRQEVLIVGVHGMRSRN
jgi:hypothetical protein